MKGECLDYRELPDQNELFLAYLSEPDKIASFYPERIFNLPDLLDRGREMLGKKIGPELAARLRNFQRRCGADATALANIDRLAQGKALVVSTGQQPGLFGGPAFTLYKALTAVRLARQLEEKGVGCVPLFWIAGNDSDFEEVRSTSLADPEGQLMTISLSETGIQSDQMVGSISPDDVQDLLNSIEGLLPPDVESLLKEAYYGSTLTEGVGRWLSQLFKGDGLVIYDPRLGADPDSLVNFYTALVSGRDQIIERLLDRGHALKELGFNPQVQVDETETLLFWQEGNARHKVHYRDGRYRLRENGRVLTVPDFLQAISEDPDNWGPNALLRPLLQDHLFPTVAYIGGPAEVAYYAQVNVIAEFLDLIPVIVPRASFTFINGKCRRLLEKYGLTPRGVLGTSRDQILERLAKLESGSDVLQDLGDLEHSLTQEISRLSKEIGKLDPPVSEMFDKAKGKMIYQLRKVRRRFVSNWEERNGHIQRHVDYLVNRLYPQGKLQERVLNANQLLADMGTGALEEILEDLNPFCTSHRILELEDRR